MSVTYAVSGCEEHQSGMGVKRGGGGCLYQPVQQIAGSKDNSGEKGMYSVVFQAQKVGEKSSLIINEKETLARQRKSYY